MERVPGMPKHTDPSTADPTSEYPQVHDKAKIDSFDFHDDPEGTKVPRAAHIRKMNPRADALPDGDSSRRHRMVRRGITYGPDFQEGEAPYGQSVPQDQDRGLLFINYQASIARTFEFVQTVWANREDFQHPGDGQDPMISQNTASRPFNLPPHGQLNFDQWVTTTGGAYLVSLSLTGLAALANVEPSQPG
jgi:deferrochelatase/peroxidase EfeB